jgi:hypothetical protein
MTHVRLKAETYEIVKMLAEKTGKSIGDIIDEAVRVYYMSAPSPEKEVKEIKQGYISLRFATKCSKCKKELREGDLAYWIKVKYADNTFSSQVICLDCFIPDSVALSKIVKKKELEKAIRALQNKFNELYEEYKELQNELRELRAKVNKWRVLKDLRDLLQIISYENKNEILAKIEALVRNLDSLEEEERMEEISIVSHKQKGGRGEHRIEKERI